MNYEACKKALIDLAVSPGIKAPSFYRICLHRDDFTPMEFVISTLERFFSMSRRKAAEVALEAHTKGMAVCGFYTKDVAESKTTEIIENARRYEHPLLCSMDVVE